MTENKDILPSLYYGSFHPSMTLADNSISFVEDIGIVNATSTLLLSFVLYIPKFPSNLLSISKISRSLNY